jgi:Tol biopolymer transport system component
MGKRNALLAAGLLMVALVVAPLASQTTNQWDKQLRAAIDKEVIDADLKGAIEQYKNIIAARGASRAVVAKAMLQLGGCYEKQGNAEARKTFEQLLKDYPEQTDVVAQARARLAALASARAGQAPGGGIRIREVWTGKDADTDASPSPDGRELAYMSGQGDLLILDLTTGVSRRLAGLGKDSPGGDGAWPLWSPDGKRIAYQWWPGKGPSEEIRLYDISAKTSRVLLASKEGATPKAWSKDGTQLLTFVTENRVTSLGLLFVDGGQFRPVKVVAQFQTAGCDLSPDGKFIAYAASPRAGTINFDLFIVDVADGKETCHLEHPAADFLIGWTPDGRYLLFQSNRTGTQGVWAQRVDNGRPVSEPALVKSFGEWLEPMGFAANGAFFYGTYTGGSDVYTAEVDFASGRATAPQKISKSHEGSNFACEFSPDGRYLAYLTVRGRISPNPPGVVGGGRADTICIYSMETGRQREYPTDVRIFDLFRPRWSSDSRYLVFTARDEKGSGLYMLDLQSGEVSRMPEEGWGEGLWFSNSKASFRSYRNMEKLTWELIRRDLQTGLETRLYAQKYYFGLPTLSPDNRYLTLVQRENAAEGTPKRLLIVSAEDGVQRVLLEEKANFDIVGWAADSRNVFVRKRSSPGAGNPYELWRIPLEGENPKRIDLTYFPHFGLMISQTAEACVP